MSGFEENALTSREASSSAGENQQQVRESVVLGASNSAVRNGRATNGGHDDMRTPRGVNHGASASTSSPYRTSNNASTYSDRFIPCRTASNLMGLPLLENPTPNNITPNSTSEREVRGSIEHTHLFI